MAFQRPFLISLKRSDSQRWGFGITGGKEYGQPLRIQSVAEDSIAERCGLHEGDEIIQVGRVNVQDLTQGQVYELLARCGNKIEMFVVREDLLTGRKGNEPPIVKAVVHNPYNSPLSLYSTENVAETLAKQTEVLTEGHISEEEEGPESLSFKEKSAVFQFLEEQAKQDTTQKTYPRATQSQVVKPKAAPPPPPPKPKPPANEALYNGYDTTTQRQQVYQDQQKTRSEYQTTQRVVNQYQYQQEQPVQYQQTSVYQTSAYQTTPDFQTTVTVEKSYSPSYQSTGTNYQQRSQQQAYQVQGPQSPAAYQQRSQQQTYQVQSPQSPAAYQQRSQQQTYQQTNYQQSQSPHSPSVNYQQHPGYQSPSATAYQPLNQVNYKQSQQSPQSRTTQQSQQSRTTQPSQQSRTTQQSQKTSYQSQAQYQGIQESEKGQQSPTAVSKAEFKIGPPPPPRSSSAKQQQDPNNMTAVYRQQYEQHLQQQYEHEQQMYMNNYDDVGSPHKAHIIKENIFENNSISGTPITYKAPPAAPPKPNWPPPPQQDQFRSSAPTSPSGMMRAGNVWPPKKSTVTELPKTGFNPAAVRESGTGRKCVWPPPKPEDEYRSGRSTPQSPSTGRRITWNPSPSPPTNRKAVFGTSNSPIRRKDIQWPPPSPTGMTNETMIRGSPRLTRKARFEDYIKEHASINVPQTYRPPPGTQHVEYR